MNYLTKAICLLLPLLIAIGCNEEATVDAPYDPRVPQTIRETGYLSCSNDNVCESGIRCLAVDDETECIEEESLGCNEVSCECLSDLCGDLTCVDEGDSISCEDEDEDEDEDDYNPCEDKECGETCTLCDPDDSDCVETRDLKTCDALGVCVTGAPDLMCAPSRVCNELEDSYSETVSSASICQVDSDCQILNGQCGVGVGGCYEAVNMSLTQSELDRLGAEYGSQCNGPVCSCMEPPTQVLCNEGVCEASWGEPVEYNPCEGKACGDTCTRCDPDDTDCAETLELKACNIEGECVADTPNLICEPGRTCDEITEAYRDRVEEASACRVNSECQILNGQCNVGVGGCYEAVNMSLIQAELDRLGAAFDEQCDGGVCSCVEPPSGAACIDGSCEAIWDAPPEYSPCEGKVCGDACTVCAPDDRSCIETDVIKACNAEGACVADTPNLICVGRTCDEITDAYREAVEGASDCQIDSDCQALIGQCGVGLGGCYEVVNMTLSQEDLNTLGAEFNSRCDEAICDCPDQPMAITCNAGTCEMSRN